MDNREDENMEQAEIPPIDAPRSPVESSASASSSDDNYDTPTKELIRASTADLSNKYARLEEKMTTMSKNIDSLPNSRTIANDILKIIRTELQKHITDAIKTTLKPDPLTTQPQTKQTTAHTTSNKRKATEDLIPPPAKAQIIEKIITVPTEAKEAVRTTFHPSKFTHVVATKSGQDLYQWLKGVSFTTQGNIVLAFHHKTDAKIMSAILSIMNSHLMTIHPATYTTVTKTTWTRVIVHRLSKLIPGSKRIRTPENLAQIFRDPNKCCPLPGKLATPLKWLNDPKTATSPVILLIFEDPDDKVKQIFNKMEWVDTQKVENPKTISMNTAHRKYRSVLQNSMAPHPSPNAPNVMNITTTSLTARESPGADTAALRDTPQLNIQQTAHAPNATRRFPLMLQNANAKYMLYVSQQDMIQCL
jgi:hypothetical protein